MGVEKWVYDTLGRPSINVVGPVLTDLFETKEIDWVRFVGESDDNGGARADIPEVRVRGGCEAAALSHYFTTRSKRCVTDTGYERGPFAIRKGIVNYNLLPAEIWSDPRWVDFIEACGFKAVDFDSNFLSPCEDGSVLIFIGWSDLDGKRYRHKPTGRILTIDISGYPYNYLAMSAEDLETVMTEKNLTPDDRVAVERAIGTLAASSEYVGPPTTEELTKIMLAFFARFPKNAFGVAIACEEIMKHPGDLIAVHESGKKFNACLREAASHYDIEVLNIGDFVMSDTERLEWWHYERIVYYRLAEAILSSVERRRAAGAAESPLVNVSG
jgi:hypothetical protein